MTRFRVYENVDDGGFLLDVQANLLSHLATCAVVPLLQLQDAPQPAKVLNPTFDVDGQRYLMATQFIATVPRRLLGKEVLDLQAQADVVVNALDCLFQGI